MLAQTVRQAMEAEYNASQMQAVTAGLDRSPVILIQVTMPSPPQPPLSQRHHLLPEGTLIIQQRSIIAQPSRAL